MVILQTQVFRERPYYLHNYVQATFDCMGRKKLKGSTLVVSGDGRYYNAEALQIVLKVAAANRVKKVVLGREGLLSTPAASNLIRTRREKRMLGGFILSASNHPGGKDRYFGIKFYVANGGPAPESITNALKVRLRSTTSVKFAADLPDIDIGTAGIFRLPGPFGTFIIEIVDPVEEYFAQMKKIFDFDTLRKFVARKDFSMAFDGMNGAAGPYAKRIFVDELGCQSSTLIRCDPKQDFGNKQPEPKLVNATLLAGMVGLKLSSPRDSKMKNYPAIGAATDGEAAKCMLLGRQLFVAPSDSLAIIAANAKQTIPYFCKGLVGVARSMPTSRAVDVVARSLSIPHYEVPTGWTHISKLMDNHKCNLAGGESSEIGSDHLREKDGIWVVLAWLSILAHRNRVVPPGMLIGVEDIAQEHWRRYGRHFCLRYDFIAVASSVASNLLRCLVSHRVNLRALNSSEALVSRGMAISQICQYSYKDPVDGSISTEEGVTVDLLDGSRFVYRFTETHPAICTIHVHVERYVRGPGGLHLHPSECLAAHVDLALHMVRMHSGNVLPEPSLVI